jgi:hypothetical protein
MHEVCFESHCISSLSVIRNQGERGHFSSGAMGCDDIVRVILESYDRRYIRRVPESRATFMAGRTEVRLRLRDAFYNERITNKRL